MYSFLVYMHIFSVILSIGPYFVLIPLLNKIKTVEPLVLGSYLDIFSFVVWLTKHAGHLLVISGILLIWVGKWSWQTPWLLLSILILLSALFFIARAFSPILRKLREPEPDREVLVKKLGYAVYLYLFIMLLVMVLMVAKPTLW